MARKNGSEELAVIPQANGLGLSQVNPTDAMRDAEVGRTKMRPKVVSLKEPGVRITGLLVGKGADVEIEDAAGDSRALGTWVFDCGNGFHFAVMTSYQLDHELPELVGKKVRVTLLGQEDTGKGRRVKNFLIEEFLDA